MKNQFWGVCHRFSVNFEIAWFFLVETYPLILCKATTMGYHFLFMTSAWTKRILAERNIVSKYIYVPNKNVYRNMRENPIVHPIFKYYHLLRFSCAVPLFLVTNNILKYTVKTLSRKLSILDCKGGTVTCFFLHTPTKYTMWSRTNRLFARLWSKLGVL